MQSFEKARPDVYFTELRAFARSFFGGAALVNKIFFSPNFSFALPQGTLLVLFDHAPDDESLLAELHPRATEPDYDDEQQDAAQHTRVHHPL